MALDREEIDRLIRESNELGKRVGAVTRNIDEFFAQFPKVQTKNGWVDQHKTLISSDSHERANALIRQAPFEHGRGRIVSYYLATPNAPLPKEVVDYVKAGVRQDTKPGAKDPSFTRDSRALPMNERMQMAIALTVADTNRKMLGTLQLSPTTNPAKAQIIIAGANNTKFSGATSGNGRIILLEENAFTGAADQEEELSTTNHELGHALGLEHPHDYTKNPNAPSSEMVGCARTVMAYYKKCLGNGNVPASSWQDLDISALRELYTPPRTQADNRQKGRAAP